jgi:RNA polymerase sigma factor (sigma-70 family)
VHTTTDLAGSALRGGGDGDGAAKRAALYERVLERVHRYFRRVVRDPGEAEECVARTLAALERSLAGEGAAYDPARSFNGWLWLKAHTVYVDWCRERERKPAPLGDREPAAPERDPARKLDAETVLREVERRLGRETYEAFLLYYEGELTQREVGEVIGRDRETVAKRIAEAHALIDALLGERGG